MLKKIIVLNICILTLLAGCGGGSTSAVDNNSQPSFLAKPTGPYNVGFQDFHFQDNSRCPDVFYQPGINNRDYSPGNTNYCREIMVRVYYPTSQTQNLGSPMYPPLVQRFVNMATDAPNMPESAIAQLYTLQSYSTNLAPIINNTQFPAVIFAHGGGSSVQEYENQIVNLASYGYIVVGVNSLFVGSYIAIPDGQMVLADESAPSSEIESQQTTDLEFVYNNLANLGSISSSIDLNLIGAAGHSYGGGSVESMITNMPGKFKAAVTEDPFYGDSFSSGQAVIINGYNIPLLKMLSGTIGYAPKTIGFSLTYMLNQNNYIIGMAPSNQILWQGTYPFYTVHSEFSDENTLKNMPGFQILNNDFIIYTGMSAWSNAPSSYLVNAIDDNEVKFFDYYLKGNLTQNPFNNCTPLVNNTVMSCGQTQYGPY